MTCRLKRHRRANRKRPGHLKHMKWVRGFKCAVDRCEDWPVIFHHVRGAGDAGMGEKDDRFGVPLCNQHHISGHQIGWRTFEAKHGLDLEAIAEQLWRDDILHGKFKELREDASERYLNVSKGGEYAE